MRIIDTHTHIFDVIAGFGGKGELRPIGNRRARWATGEEMEMVPEGLGEDSFTAEALVSLLRGNGVEKAVLLQGGLYGFQNDATLRAAEKYPDLLVPSLTYDPFSIHAETVIRRFVDEGPVSIIKFELSTGVGIMSYHPVFPIDGGALEPAVQALRKKNGTLVLDVGSPGMPSFQPKGIGNIADRYPDLRIVVCHLLAPKPQDEACLTESLKLLRKPNIWFDLSAIPWNVDPEPYPYPTGQKFLRIARELVGPSQLMWGTDVPLVLTKAGYQDLLQYIIEGGIFTENELDGVFFRNAADAYPLA